MHQNLEQYIKDLTLIPGLSGHEQLVSKYLKEKFDGFGLETKVDTLGNTIGCIKGQEGEPTILITAHMDSLGLMVKKITDKGFIKFERVGGIPEKTLPALHVTIGTKNGTYIPGVIGVKSHHFATAEDKYKVDRYQELYIDIGCSSKKEAEDLGVQIGSPIVYEPYFGKLNKSRITGTWFDNRIMCACLVDLAEILSKQKPKATVYLAGTVQEEYTIRGAITAARITKPDVVICLDVTIEGSTPDLDGTNDIVCGNGPAISLYNFHGRGTLNGTMPHPAVVRLYEQTAEQMNINLQRDVHIGGLTELSYMQLEGNGIAGADVAVPCRYTHSPVEVADIKDVEQAIDLTVGCINNLTKDFNMER